MGVVAGPALATTYSVTDLGSLGFGESHGLAINAVGQVTGYSFTSNAYEVSCPPAKYGRPKHCFENPYHAFLWSNGKMTEIPLNFPDAINDNGVIVGGPMVYSGGTLQNLNTLVPAGTPRSKTRPRSTTTARSSRTLRRSGERHCCQRRTDERFQSSTAFKAPGRLEDVLGAAWAPASAKLVQFG
jgi:uncharacterized membrane protein